MDSHEDPVLLEWIEGRIPECSQIQKLIFSDWLKRMRVRISELNLSKKSQEELLKNKMFSYLFSHYSMMHSPFELPDIKIAISILKESYNSQNSIIVFYGDRDADGISSLAILYLFFRDELKYPKEKLIMLTPLEDDKYGITEEVVDRILKEEPEILITLDCGSSNQKEINSFFRKHKELYGEKQKPKVIIIDHHFMPEKVEDYPLVEAFINPKRLPPDNSNRELCTAGLAYKLIWAFTYSFTSEYDKTYQILPTDYGEDSLYFKNLLEVLDSERMGQVPHESLLESQASIPKQEMHSIQLSSYWDQAISSSSFFARIHSFAKSFGFSLNIEDRTRFLFQAKLQKVWEKTKIYLVLSAIGSVADMVPLIDDNRIIVQEGIALLNQNLKVAGSSHPSLEGILALVRLLFFRQNQIGEEDFAFSICPAINAAGRLGQPFVALSSLIEKDRLLAAQKASELKKLNEQRKKISKSITQEIILDSSSTIDQKDILIVYDSKIHRGISGLVANHLCEHFNKPVLVLVDDGDAIRGSIRSSQNQDVFSFLAKLEHLFIQFGGHKQAAGFSLEKDQLENFIREAEILGKKYFLEGVEAADEMGNTHNDRFQPIFLHDHEIDTSIWKESLFFAPFGKNNPAPVLAIQLTKGVECENLGKTGEHVKIRFLGIKDRRIEGVWFFHKGEIEKLKHDVPKSRQTLFAEPSISTWMGKKVYRLKITKFSLDEISSTSV